jgi:hypothetical protein
MHRCFLSGRSPGEAVRELVEHRSDRLVCAYHPSCYQYHIAALPAPIAYPLCSNRNKSRMASNDSTLKDLLQKNAMWAQAVVAADPNFFEESAKGQSPQVSLLIIPLRFSDAGFCFSFGTSLRICADDFCTLISFLYASCGRDSLDF